MTLPTFVLRDVYICLVFSSLSVTVGYAGSNSARFMLTGLRSNRILMTSVSAAIIWIVLLFTNIWIHHRLGYTHCCTVLLWDARVAGRSASYFTPYCLLSLCIDLKEVLVFFGAVRRVKMFELLSPDYSYWLNSMEQSPSWEANTHSVKKFPAFYGTWRFITVFTAAHHWSLSEPDASSPHLPSRFL
jgi:hypothetical protein